MEWLLILLLILLLLILVGRGGSSQQVRSWREREVESDDSFVVYRDGDGVQHRENDGCNGCIQIRAEQLQRRGYVVEDVEIGRHNSGGL
jgi:hypothetical protein